MKKFYLGFILLVIISCNKQVDYSKDINELKSQISLLQGQIGGLRKTTDSLTNELKGINTQVNEVSRKVDSILNRITVINTQLIDLNSQLTKNGTDIISLLKKIEDLQIELINLTKLIQDLKYQQNITFGYEVVPVDQRLKSTNKGVITIPVVIVNYLPTTDGLTLDKSKVIDSCTTCGPNESISLLTRAKEKILKDKIIEKNAIEEGTKFRDYATNKVKQYIDIDVVAYINVYDIKYNYIGISSNYKKPWWNIDFNDLLTKINLKNYVDNMGAKEVWFTSFPRENGYLSFNVPESNMSPKIGASFYDVSNGGGDMTDLPRYNNTYVVYGDNGWRGVDTDLHNRGHQLERQMMFIDNTTWSNQFAKVERAGNTHWCPNSTKDYDYWNKTFVKSDIMTWKPSGGTFVDVNVDTWLGKNYQFESSISMLSPGPFKYESNLINYSNDAQVKWFIFWWQSVPGHLNNVKFSKHTINISQIDIDNTDSLDKNIYVEYYNEYNSKQIKKYKTSKVYIDDIFSEGNVKIYYFDKNKNIVYNTISTSIKTIGTLNNWWDIFYNWDDAIKNKTKLTY